MLPFGEIRSRNANSTQWSWPTVAAMGYNCSGMVANTKLNFLTFETMTWTPVLSDEMISKCLCCEWESKWNQVVSEEDIRVIFTCCLLLLPL